MAFNINAQVVLTGPKNIRAVTNSIRQQLGNLNVNVNVAVPKRTSIAQNGHEIRVRLPSKFANLRSNAVAHQPS